MRQVVLHQVHMMVVELVVKVIQADQITAMMEHRAPEAAAGVMLEMVVQAVEQVTVEMELKVLQA
jgi:hypothetical protein